VTGERRKIDETLTQRLHVSFEFAMVATDGPALITSVTASSPDSRVNPRYALPITSIFQYEVPI